MNCRCPPKQRRYRASAGNPGARPPAASLSGARPGGPARTKDGLIAVPDPALRCQTWGGFSAGPVETGVDDNKSYDPDEDFEGVERDCVDCGKRFSTTPKRRLLCHHCFLTLRLADDADG